MAWSRSKQKMKNTLRLRFRQGSFASRGEWLDYYENSRVQIVQAVEEGFERFDSLELLERLELLRFEVFSSETVRGRWGGSLSIASRARISFRHFDNCCEPNEVTGRLD